MNHFKIHLESIKSEPIHDSNFFGPPHLSENDKANSSFYIVIEIEIKDVTLEKESKDTFLSVDGIMIQ